MYLCLFACAIKGHCSLNWRDTRLWLRVASVCVHVRACVAGCVRECGSVWKCMRVYGSECGWDCCDRRSLRCVLNFY